MGYRDSGSFVNTSNVWDSSQLGDIEGITPPLRELFIRLYQNLNNMALAVNGKDTGIYHTDEFVTGQLYPQDPNLSSGTNATPIQRPVYRKVINFGALPTLAAPGPSTSVAHGIDLNEGYAFTRIYGCASKQDTNPALCSYLPIPYASPIPANNIELAVMGTNIVITVGVDRSLYTQCWVVLEYIKF